MSSIKRDLKKKPLRRPEAERIFCLQITSGGGPSQARFETWQARRILKWQPWFYRRVVAYRYFGLSEEGIAFNW
jgi:hypothetical protein